ncbi:MAG: type II/IV secretion system ATPase subunit [Candidatus Woesearchaeota archaeon]
MKLKEYETCGQKKLLDSYTLVSDNVPVTVNIWDCSEESIPVYEIKFPAIGAGTSAFLDALRDEVARDISVKNEILTDPKVAARTKSEYHHKIRHMIKDRLPGTPEDHINLFAGMTLHKMYGLGDMEIVLSDNFLEEVAVNSAKQPVSVYHKKHGWCKTMLFVENEEEIYNISSLIGRNVGKDITNLNPMMDAHLLSGDRVASTLFPISTGGNTITIRRFARVPWTVTHFISPEYKTMSVDVAALLWMAMHYELNVVVAGGTASGKTSVLNTLASFIPPTQRIISVEDTREINLPKPLHWNWVPLASRTPNLEGQGSVSMLDLIQASLRMRPDRIVVGEIRKPDQAEALFEAMHTGHSIYATMHADTAQQVQRRLTEPPMNVPVAEVSSLHLILVQYRDRRTGRRRTMELTELLPTSGETSKLELNPLYRWRPRVDKFEEVNKPTRLFDELNLHTGMTVKEIEEDLEGKKSVLNWMIKNKLFDIDQVGDVFRIYYKEPSLLLNAVKEGWTYDRLVGK